MVEELTIPQFFDRMNLYLTDFDKILLETLTFDEKMEVILEYARECKKNQEAEKLTGEMIGKRT